VWVEGTYLTVLIHNKIKLIKNLKQVNLGNTWNAVILNLYEIYFWIYFASLAATAEVSIFLEHGNLDSVKKISTIPLLIPHKIHNLDFYESKERYQRVI
jgi:hypothetical protein